MWIAHRLALHESPRAKVHSAAHLRTLGRTLDAARMSLEAGRTFASVAAWTSALAAYDGAIEWLEDVATSSSATLVLRDAQFARSDALVQLGHFAAAIRSLGAVLDLTAAGDDADASVRSRSFSRAGHAYLRLKDANGAWMSARQAVAAAERSNDVEAEFEAANLTSLLLFSEARYDASARNAAGAYERAIAHGAYRSAATLAQRVGESVRRLLRFDDAMAWLPRQLSAAVLAGPDIEAQVQFTEAALRFALDDLEGARASGRSALDILGTIRRRPIPAGFPIGFFEWNCHTSMAYVALETGRLNEALAECEWILASPWIFNTTQCSAVTLGTLVEVWLAEGSARSLRSATTLARRAPVVAADDPFYTIDLVARTRLCVATGAPDDARRMLAESLDVAAHTALLVPDQIHIIYDRITRAARGFDDALARRSEVLGRRHRETVAAAAGTLWKGQLQTVLT